MIEFQCPECCRCLKVKPELAGRVGKCPGCGKRIRLPENPSLANEFPADWFPELAALSTSGDFPGVVTSLAPTRSTAADLVLMPSRLHMLCLFATAVLSLLAAPMFYFSNDPRLPVVALPLALVGLLGIALGIFLYATYGPLLKFSRDGLYYSLVKKTIPWQDIEEAYYWNSYQELSDTTRVAVSLLTKNRHGATFIKIRLTPGGRQRHKRPVPWTLDCKAFAGDDMVIPMNGLRTKDLRTIDILGEIKKRAHAC